MRIQLRGDSFDRSGARRLAPAGSRAPHLVGLLVAATLALMLLEACQASRPELRAPTPGSHDEVALPDGPLVVPEPHGWATTQPVGRVFTDGLEVLRLDTDQTATIESIELVGAQDLEIVGALLAPPPRTYGAETVMRSFPPRRPALFDRASLVEATGATIGPRAGAGQMGWELLLGLRATAAGIGFRDGIRIVYSVDGTRHDATFPAEVSVCTSPGLEVDGSCPFRKDL